MTRALLSTLMLIACCMTFDAHAADVEQFVLLDHDSNFFRGYPWNSQEERQQESLMYGATVTAGKHRAWELDFAHGVQRVERGAVESATKLAVRFYPGRVKRGR